MNKEILRRYNPKGNTAFSKLSTKDIDLLLNMLQNYYISFQNKLNLSKLYSFGFEYECDDINRVGIGREFFKKRLYPEYQVKEEDTVHNGGEIVTPILHNIKANWKKVEQVLGIIKQNSTNTENCGAHIHVGSHIMDTRQETWENFFMIWSIYENIITRFLNGEYLNTRVYASTFAKPVSDLFKEVVLSGKLKDMNNQSKMDFHDISVDRYLSVNLNCVHNVNNEIANDTIEFRSPNGTFNPIIWQNNLNMILHLLLKSSHYSHTILLDRLKKEYMDTSSYSKINIIKALEFADLIFDNNLDKLNFLRQYFKDYKETDEIQLVKSRPFTY